MVRPPKPRPSLVGLLIAASIASTFVQGALSVLGVMILQDFTITAGTYGSLFAIYSGVAALTSVPAGIIADRHIRFAVAGVFVSTSLSLLGMSIVTGFWGFAAAVAIAGLALGSGNPSTNRMIATDVSLQYQGVILGIKQAGPQLGVVIAGFSLPALSAHYGWRASLVVFSVLSALGAMTVLGVTSGEDRVRKPRVRIRFDRPTRLLVTWLTVLGFAVALTNASLMAFLPLYARDVLEFSLAASGALIAVMGFVGAVGRISWGIFGSRFRRSSSMLIALSGLSLVSTGLLTFSAAEEGGQSAWIASILAGASILSWHLVAWLVLIRRVDQRIVGRASGIFQTGSTVGFGVGPAVAGLLLGASGSYVVVWTWLTAVMTAVTVATMIMRWKGSQRLLHFGQLEET